MSRECGALPIGFFDRDAEVVAEEVLGAYLVSRIAGELCIGRIVETEAYPGPHDPASHASRSIGRTRRNEPMFGRPGTAYIHLNYGVHWCLNIVTGAAGYPAAVLIRALEPVEGIEVMQRRRSRENLTDLCSGPAKLTQALGIGPELQTHPLSEEPLFVARGEPPSPSDIVRTPRIGISRGTDARWRFYDQRSPCVSRRAPAG